MTNALGNCCCVASTDSSALCRRKVYIVGPNSGEFRSRWLGGWSGHGSSSFGFPVLRKLNRRHSHVISAAWDEISHNQVLMSSAAAGVLGQLVKPFTSALSGKGFNLKLIIKPGGMPSTHSATVTAAATAMGLERGLSDPLFGFAVIVACLFMYDAQGVRRSVGKQAEVINTLVLNQMAESEPTVAASPNLSPYAIGVELARDPVQAELKFMEEADSSVSSGKSSKATAVFSEDPLSKVNGTLSRLPPSLDNNSQGNGGVLGRTKRFFDAARNLPSVKDGQVTLQEIGDLSGWRHIPLKESVGHTKVEVLVGGLWGIAATLALHSAVQF